MDFPLSVVSSNIVTSFLAVFDLFSEVLTGSVRQGELLPDLLNDFLLFCELFSEGSSGSV